MRKNLKKSITLLLSVVMVLTVVPAESVYATEVDSESVAVQSVENLDEQQVEEIPKDEAVMTEETGGKAEEKKEVVEAEKADEKETEKVEIKAAEAEEETGDADENAQKTVTIASVPVVYTDGSPVEDGHVLDFSDSNVAGGNTKTYTVKDGKITGVEVLTGTHYKVGPSWDDPDENWSWDYVCAYGQNGYLRVAVNEDSETLMSYDMEAGEITSTPVKKIVIKEYDADDPAVKPGDEISVADLPVVYEDGTPVEDGVTIDLFNMSNIWSAPTKYTVENGKISGITMAAETQYKIGFDVDTNGFYKQFEVVGAYNSKKLLRIFARYEKGFPLYYDYDEGVDGEEIRVTQLVVKKVADADDTPFVSNSCIMQLLLSDNGYYAEGGLSFTATRQDNGKSKTVYSKEGELTLIAEANVEYLLKLNENDTYEIDFDKNPIFTPYKELGGIPFICQIDRNGKWHAVLKGYNVEQDEGKLNYTYVDLKRIDGKENAGDKPFDDGSCDSPEVDMVYTADVVTLTGMPVNEVTADGETTPLEKEITFDFYDCTTQTITAEVTSKDGILPDVEMVKGHHYIVTAKNLEYEMPSYYITLSATGNQPLCYKCNNTEDSFDLTKRETPLSDISEANRTNVTLPVYYMTADGDLEQVSGIKVRLVSPLETVEVKSVEGKISVNLLEDTNYMVLVDDEKYSIESFPLTVKDKSEYGNGWGKFPFNHFSCGSVSGLFLVDKGTEHDRDVVMIGSSGETTVTGLNFGKGSYFIHDRVLENYTVKELTGKDYEVVDIDAINMYRTEISKLVAGDFTITKTVPEGKMVTNVYYIDEDNALQKLNFTESNGKVTFVMNSISMYNTVIEYKNKPESISSAQVSLSKTKYTYSGKSLKPSVKVVNKKGNVLKAGTDYTVAYSNNKKVGTAKVVVALKGDYEGTITKMFVINPKATSLKSVKKAKKAFNVKWSKKTTQTTGYQIQYSTNKKFTKNVKSTYIKKTKTTSKKVTKLRKNKKYYVRVRTYKKVGNKKYYSSWSKVKSVKTK